MTAPYVPEEPRLAGIGGMLRGPDELAPADVTTTRNPMPREQALMGIIQQLAGMMAGAAMAPMGGAAAGGARAMGAGPGAAIRQAGRELPREPMAAGEPQMGHQMIRNTMRYGPGGEEELVRSDTLGTAAWPNEPKKRKKPTGEFDLFR